MNTVSSPAAEAIASVAVRTLCFSMAVVARVLSVCIRFAGPMTMCSIGPFLFLIQISAPSGRFFNLPPLKAIEALSSRTVVPTEAREVWLMRRTERIAADRVICIYSF